MVVLNLETGGRLNITSVRFDNLTSSPLSLSVFAFISNGKSPSAVGEQTIMFSKGRLKTVV